MPKLTLTFNLPEEKEEAELASKANAMSCVLSELDMFLRKHIKYAPDSQRDEITAIYESIRNELHQLCAEGGIDL